MLHLDWDTQVLKKENHPKVLKEGTPKVITLILLVIIVVRKDIQEKSYKLECKAYSHGSLS